jgi:hypothetical protein
MNIKTEEIPQFDWDGGPVSMLRAHCEPPFRPKTPKEPKVLRLAFRPYVNNPGYLNAMRLGAARVNLNGEDAGKVSENDVKSAQERPTWTGRFRKERRREEVAQAAPLSACTPLASAPPPPPTPPRDSLSTLVFEINVGWRS